MKLRYFIALAMALAVASSSANAAIMGFDITPVDNTAGGAALAGKVTQDISISGTGQLTGVQMLLQLSAGSIYQDGFGGDTPPNPAFIPVFPSVAYDTFVALGGVDANTDNPGNYVIPGGAVNIGGAAGSTFDTAKLDITWAPDGANPVFDPTDYMVARVTLSGDAAGTALLLGSTFGEANFVTAELPIVDGQIMLGTATPVAQAAPGSGDISLQGAFNDGTGLMAQAIMVMTDIPADPAIEITGLNITNDTYGLFGALGLGGDKVDLTIDVDAARALPKGTLATADLQVTTTYGGDFSYRLSAVVPEPSTIALAGLALVGLVGYSRRK